MLLCGILDGPADEVGSLVDTSALLIDVLSIIDVDIPLVDWETMVEFVES